MSAKYLFNRDFPREQILDPPPKFCTNNYNYIKYRIVLPVANIAKEYISCRNIKLWLSYNQAYNDIISSTLNGTINRWDDLGVELIYNFQENLYQMSTFDEQLTLCNIKI